MGTPSSINQQVLRKLCAKFDTFVTSVTIRPIFCTKRLAYRDTFDFSQGHVTMNQPMAVPV